MSVLGVVEVVVVDGGWVVVVVVVDGGVSSPGVVGGSVGAGPVGTVDGGPTGRPSVT
jgi:hypothetical protein